MRQTINYALTRATISDLMFTIRKRIDDDPRFCDEGIKQLQLLIRFRDALYKTL